MANVEAWALGIGDEMSHDLAGESSFVAQHMPPVQHESHDCGHAGQHCCHALNHLLGQITDSFPTTQAPTTAKPFADLNENTASFAPEDIYRPPRKPSLT